MGKRSKPKAKPVTQRVWFQTHGPNLALLTLLTVILFWKVFLHPTQMFWSTDIIRAHFEYKMVQWNSIWKWGHFPLWDPTCYCGKSIVGDPLQAVLYPANWLFWIFPSPVTFGFFLWFSVTLGAWGMFLFAREKKCDVAGALIAAFAFILGGKTAAHLFAGHIEVLLTMFGLPWILWGVERLLQNPSWGRAAIVGMVTALVATCGSVQIMYWHFLFIVVYVQLRTVSEFQGRASIRGILRSRAFLLVAGLTFAAIAAPWWFPIVRQTLILGARTREIDFEFATSDSAGLTDLLRSIWPYFGKPLPTTFRGDPYHKFSWETLSYPGVIILSLAVAAPLFLKPRKDVIGLWLLGLLTILLAMGNNTPVYALIYKIVPGFNLFRCPGRLFFYSNFVVALLAGMMVTGVGESKNRRWWPLVPCLFLIGVLIGTLILKSRVVPPVTSGLWIPLILLAVFAPVSYFWASGKIPDKFWRPLVLVLAFTELGLFWQTNIHVVEISRIAPPISMAGYLAEEHEKEDFRIYDPTKIIEQHTAARYGLEIITGYHPGIYARHLDLYRKIWREDRSFIGEQYMHGIADVACPVILDMMNTKYFITTEKSQNSDYEQISRIETKGSSIICRLYRRNTVLPRAFLVASAEVPPPGESVLDNLCQLDPKKSCLVDDNPIPGAAEYQPLTAQRSSPGDITLPFSNTEAGVVVISEVWHPDWYATDNGRRVDIRRVNYNFLGIPVPPGSHNLRVWYRPWDFYLGLAVSAAAALVILAASLLHWKSKHKKAAEVPQSVAEEA